MYEYNQTNLQNFFCFPAIFKILCVRSECAGLVIGSVGEKQKFLQICVVNKQWYES